MSFNYHLLAFQHLLGTAILAGLTLVLSMRMPEPGAERSFRLALLLEAFSGIGVLPLFMDAPSRGLVTLSLAAFAAASLGFLIFTARTILERKRAITERRQER